MTDEEIIAYIKPKILAKFKVYESWERWMTIEVNGLPGRWIIAKVHYTRMDRVKPFKNDDELREHLVKRCNAINKRLKETKNEKIDRKKH
jgi:hypothetical protein